MFKLNKWMLLLALLGGLGAFHFIDRQVAIGKAVKATEGLLKASYEAKLNDAITKARNTEDKLRADAEQLKKDKDAKIKDIDGQLSLAISELHKRPKRPTDNPTPPTDTSSCTARELYQEDAEFLARESARAESVLIERDYYYEQYERARKELTK